MFLMTETEYFIMIASRRAQHSVPQDALRYDNATFQASSLQLFNTRRLLQFAGISSMPRSSPTIYKHTCIVSYGARL